MIRSELNAISNQEQTSYKIPQAQVHGFRHSLRVDCNNVEPVLPLSSSVPLSVVELLTEDTR